MPSCNLSRWTAVAAAREESLVDACHFKLVDVVAGSLVLVVLVEVAVLEDLLRLAARPSTSGSLCCGCCSNIVKKMVARLRELASVARKRDNAT